jgi:hypothetical protein
VGGALHASEEPPRAACHADVERLSPGSFTFQIENAGIYAYPAKGQTPQQQAQDTSECQAWAKQQTGWDPATSTAKSAGVGLASGALTGAALGSAGAGTGAATGAAVGSAAYGGTSQYGKGQEGYDQAFGACMSGRGYTTK